MTRRYGVAVIGAGYWGPNLARNFRAHPAWDLVAVCDRDESRALAVVGERSTVDVETSVEAVLARADVDAVAIATPAATHASIALAALDAGKHVLVEKPLAPGSADASKMVRTASDAGLTLMIDHTYCYTPAVQYIHDVIAKGMLGRILYIESTRINLGLIQPDVDVLWDLAPHDLSVLDYILPGGLAPTRVSATESDPLGSGKSCVSHLTVEIGDGASAHISVNWLSPTKIRQMVIGGSHRTLVWDDLDPIRRVSLHDRGVTMGQPSQDDRRRAAVSYRLGDITVPALAETEALRLMVGEFAAAIREDRPARTDGAAGLRVLSVLEAASHSAAHHGEAVRPRHVDSETGDME
ncbi:MULTISPECIES: Gfo/Idh/MocA family protein [unclassified Rhodococcus (in: high G+C Gram-positive bacteria)]|uniref:Gfo/Idh/MocA family protein n=1 Tax=unclassified Rhodococcus (in: high G+C Gram-positive bacteria) TaxID=192944 RepID=UPI0006FD7C92|nr:MULTISPECIES: Gfo/Idh/MocA family oxidoreductase [unclassified Rhodococcus (in: high G+C Gram-positive bacteria)]KQU36096.1 oxidoreductase [Rhodococcus sp. Leaf225]KQU48644.1 oxidoreductase [Rhodococcus sp. Leaf258]